MVIGLNLSKSQGKSYYCYVYWIIVKSLFVGGDMYE